MTVILMTRVTPGLRGKLTRWMLEVHPGVFVGTLSPRVRDGLWALVSRARRSGACTMITRAPTEQGFALAAAGDPARTVVDYDGLALLRRRHASRRNQADPARPDR